ncbi:hypothetical protein [Aeromonas rivipollensis]|uniref:hypothetical protein n=1 Tax=Aeromonas rivipollensis TaxID=948519 RepID=UPI00373AEC9B
MIKEYVTSVRQAITEGNWYCALSLALALPDICGSIEYPTEQSSKNRYIAWYGQYVAHKFPEVFSEGVGDMLLSGSDCYALRCSFLHNGSEDITHQRAKEVMDRFYFVQPLDNWSFNTRTQGAMLIVQVDRFCLLVCNSVDAWMVGRVISEQKFLTIYNPKTDGVPL